MILGQILTGYLGTYTKKDSEGVYRFTFDTDQEKVTAVDAVGHVDNPTYVTPSSDGKFLYAVSKEGDEGGVTAFKIDPDTKALTQLNSVKKAGSPPCHVSVNKANTLLVTANYHTKEIISYHLNDDGSIKGIADIKEHDGNGPHERQEKPHMHFSGFTPDERYVIAIDLGSDEITSYLVEANGTLTKEAVFVAPRGSGPRHIAFHPNKKIAYVMTELTSVVLTLAYDENTGVFTLINTIKAIPDTHTTVNDGSAVHVTKDGKFVYVGNRGHNSVTIFKVNQSDFSIELVDYQSSLGDWPRDFALTPDDQYLICSNQNSGTLAVFKRDEKTGKLTALQEDITAPEAVCVKFL